MVCRIYIWVFDELMNPTFAKIMSKLYYSFEEMSEYLYGGVYCKCMQVGVWGMRSNSYHNSPNYFEDYTSSIISLSVV